MPKTSKNSNYGPRSPSSPNYGFGANVPVRRLSSKSAPGSRNSYMGFSSQLPTQQQVVPVSTDSFYGFGDAPLHFTPQ